MLSIWYDGFDFLLIRIGDIGSSKKRCPTKEKKNAKKKKEDDPAEMKTWYRASLKKVLHKCEEKR